MCSGVCEDRVRRIEMGVLFKDYQREKNVPRLKKIAVIGLG
jgi:hypothetical protein